MGWHSPAVRRCLGQLGAHGASLLLVDGDLTADGAMLAWVIVVRNVGRWESPAANQGEGRFCFGRIWSPIGLILVQ